MLNFIYKINFDVRPGSVRSHFSFNIRLDDLAELNNYNNRLFVIAYADDKQISLSVSELQNYCVFKKNTCQAWSST